VLPKSQRLVKQKDILNAVRSKLLMSNEYCSVNYKAGESFRLLVIVPKKVLKKSNNRNRLRRRILALINNDLRLKNIHLVIRIKNKSMLSIKTEDIRRIWEEISRLILS
jgi:ribonuclease P protein component